MRYDTLSESQNAKLSATLRDLQCFLVGGVSILRGKANAIEEAALAKLANPGKTKHLERDDRGILAVQRMLDRAQTLLRLALGNNVDNFNFQIAETTVPRDACIQARNGQGDSAVKATWERDWSIVQGAKTIWLAMKAKYSEDQLASTGTLTMEGKARKAVVSKAKSDLAIFTSLRAMYPGNNIAVLDEMAKYEANPATYKLPSATETPDIVEVAQTAMAAQA